MLQLLQDIARHLEVRTTVTPEQLRDLMTKTDIRGLTNRMDELAEPAIATAAEWKALDWWPQTLRTNGMSSRL